jgi:predicted GH43/DUF377 family glycosyl hydrolase
VKHYPKYEREQVQVFTRNADNPILSAADLGWEGANSVFNPGATRLRDGSIALLIRVEDRRGHSSIHVARSADGRTAWTAERSPLLAPREEFGCEWGFEDARVSFVPELDRYVVTCTAYGSTGPCVYLATSYDLTSLDSGSVVLPPEDKNAALLPRKIGNHWMLLHRPVVMANNSCDVWISTSDDLESWRHPQPVLLRRPAGWWDAARVGIGPPPIETTEGWLQIYHGVRSTMSGSIYRVGAAMLALDEPWRVTHRLPHWILGPDAPYERSGDVNNVVFPVGAICVDDQIDLYYGAADSVVGLATASCSAVVEQLLLHPVES